MGENLKNEIVIREVSFQDSKEIYLSAFTILVGERGYTHTHNGSISIGNESKIANDVIIFLWDYIIEYHQNENEESRIYYQSTIDDISSRLKTLRRSEKLNNILENKHNHKYVEYIIHSLGILGIVGVFYVCKIGKGYHYD